MNHNGVNSLNFSPETGKLVLTTGDGGSGYDPFNLSQDDMEIAGKIIEIDVTKNTYIDNPPVVTRFNELPAYSGGAYGNCQRCTQHTRHFISKVL